MGLLPRSAEKERMTAENVCPPEGGNALPQDDLEDIRGLMYRRECVSDLVELFDQSPNPFIRCEENGRLIYVNRAAVSSVLPGPAMVLPGNLLHPLHTALKTRASQVCEMGPLPQWYQMIIVPDRDRAGANIHGKELVPDRFAETEPLRVEIMLLEKENHRLAEQLLHAQKHHAPEDVVQNFKNILTTINGYVDLCIEKTKKDGAPCYFLHKIKNLTKEAIEKLRPPAMSGKTG